MAQTMKNLDPTPGRRPVSITNDSLTCAEIDLGGGRSLVARLYRGEDDQPRAIELRTAYRSGGPITADMILPPECLADLITALQSLR